MKQLHKRMTTEEVVQVLERYLLQEIEMDICLRLLKIERRQFFKLLNKYRGSPSEFNISYERKKASRGIDEKIEQSLRKELAKEKWFVIRSPKKFPRFALNVPWMKNAACLSP
jgi:hypothetical protein